ncbi:amidohydrolase [Patescibacteria group bacterium]|nr:amidohydrolase [Patescibacteria group bacterium]MBU4073627.1 amidohydrolase [Patescibacteria group bacterium]
MSIVLIKHVAYANDFNNIKPIEKGGNAMSEKLKELARGVEEYVLRVRRYLHSMPELRWQEEKTLAYIINEVKTITADSNVGTFEIYTHYKGGIAVDLIINPDFDRVLFRADVDALPVQEETGLSFSSTVHGVSHACGHDINAAMLLGAIKLIAEGKIIPKHNFRFVFQRAEENPITESGGVALVRENVLFDISSAYALHVFTENESKPGQFQTRKGGMLSNSGRVKIEAECIGGHVAMPHNGSNASDILADLIVGLRHFAITNLGPLEPISFVPASVGAGEPNASNVRPGKATLWYAFRHLLSAEKAEQVRKALDSRAKAIVSAYPDAKVSIKHFAGHPALINNPSVTESVMNLLTEAGEEVVEIDPVFGGEDFAHYLAQVPGNMMMLGAWQEGSGGHHTKNFNPDESIFWKGVLYWLLLATN